jgi:hypothetical protein
LTEDEHTLLRWLIEHGSSEAQEYFPQIERASVVSHCRCGCPTIDLGIGGALTSTAGPSHILADYIGETPEGWLVGVLLHAREGKLSELEIYNLSEHEGPYSLPLISSLKPFY